MSFLCQFGSGGLKLGFPGGANGKEPVRQCRRCQRHGFDPWVGKILGMVYPDRSSPYTDPFLFSLEESRRHVTHPLCPGAAFWPGSLLPPLHCRPGSRALVESESVSCSVMSDSL